MPEARRPPADLATSSADDRRDRRSNRQAQVRARLIEGGLELFRLKGFDATAVAEIAAAAGVSRRTFFRYFESKDDVVFDWLDEHGDFVNQRLALRQAGVAPMPAMRDALLELARYLDTDRARAALLTRIVFDTPSLNRRYLAETARWEEEVTRILLSGRRAGEAFAIRVQVATATAGFAAAMRAWAGDNHGGELAEWVRRAVTALEQGLEDLRAARPIAGRKPAAAKKAPPPRP